MFNVGDLVKHKVYGFDGEILSKDNLGNYFLNQTNTGRTFGPVMESDLDLIKKSSNTSSNIQVGDRVKLIDSYTGPYAGMEGNVSKVNPAITGTVSIKFDDGKEYTYYNCHVEHVKASSFDVGDEVYYIGQDPSYQAIIGSVLSKGIHTASVSFSVLGGRVVLFKNDDLVKKINLATPVNPQTQAIRTGIGTYTNPIFFSGAGGSLGRSGTLNGVVGVTMQQSIDNVSKGVCRHDWKFYMGLNERFEFCTSCNEKRDTDRRA